MTRQNPVTEQVPIELGGKLRHLQFDMQAMALIREELEADLLTSERGVDGVRAEDIGTVVWAALTHEDPALDVDGEERKRVIKQVRRWITMPRLPEIMEAVDLAFGKSMPEPSDEPPDPNGSRPSRSPGSITGPSPVATLASAKPISGASRRANSSRSSNGSASASGTQTTAPPS